MSGSHCDLGACITKVASWRTEEERTGLQFYAEHAQTFLADEIYETAADRSWVSYEPVGVVLAVMPWNFPLWQVFRFAAPALMAGNAALLKHSPNTTGAALACQHILTAAGLPDGLFTTLLVADPQVPAITERLIAACGGYFCFRWVRQSPIAARRRRCWAAAAVSSPWSRRSRLPMTRWRWSTGLESSYLNLASTRSTVSRTPRIPASIRP